MSNLPLDKQFSHLGLSASYDSSPDSVRRFGPSVPPKPKKAQPQVPVVPKSDNIPKSKVHQPSFCQVLTASAAAAAAANNYSNIYENRQHGSHHMHQQHPIYSNIHQGLVVLFVVERCHNFCISFCGFVFLYVGDVYTSFVNNFVYFLNSC